MWICLNTGFLSVIADKDPAKLIVLARRKRDLLNTFGQDAKIVETVDRHYRWRVFIDRENFKAVVAGQIDAIDYTNFRKSVKDKDLHEMYREFWLIHRQYQENDRSSHFVWEEEDAEFLPPTPQSDPSKRRK